MIFLKKGIKGAGLATLSFNRYNMAQNLLGRSCLKSFNIMKKLPLSLLLRSGKFESESCFLKSSHVAPTFDSVPCHYSNSNRLPIFFLQKYS